MFGPIFWFEVRFQLRQPAFYVGAAVFALLSFGAVTTDAVMIGGSIGNVFRNAPFVVMQILLVMSVVGVFITTAIAAGTVHRDFEQGTDALFLSRPIRRRDYLWGRFLGGMLVSACVFVLVALAIALGGLMPWLEPERIGPFQAAPYLFGLLVLVLPNLLLCGSISFALATLTRSLLYTYVGVVVLFMGYMVGSQLLGSLEHRWLAVLLDPFGFAAFGLATRYWTVAEKNGGTLPADALFVASRLLWVGVALAVMLLTHVRFRPDSATRRARQGSAADEPPRTRSAGTRCP